MNRVFTLAYLNSLNYVNYDILIQFYLNCPTLEKKQSNGKPNNCLRGESERDHFSFQIPFS